MRCSKLMRRAFPFLGLVAFVACDSTTRITLRLNQFQTVEVVSITPVKNVGGVWVRACNGDYEKYQVAFNLRATRADADQDLQIRPFEDDIDKDYVLLGTSVSEKSLELSLMCTMAHDGTLTQSTCSNPVSTGTTELGFFDNLRNVAVSATRNVPDAAATTRAKSAYAVGVAVLIDQSGSTSGLVDRDTHKEGQPGLLDYPNDFTQHETDRIGLRLQAAKQIINKLNPGDPAIVFSFGGNDNKEAAVATVCNLLDNKQPTVVGGQTIWSLMTPDPNQSIAETLRLGSCYTTTRSTVLGADPVRSSAIDGLQGRGVGRSNLWAGVKKAWEFMKLQGQVAKHIVVIADGPDTCTSDAEEFQHCFTFNDTTPAVVNPQGECPDVAGNHYGEVKALIEKDILAGHTNIHVSFIHFNTKGYPQADPRMSEMACVTGGHYQFLNFERIAKTGGERQLAILRAAEKVRYTFGGYWTLVSDVPPLTSAPGVGGGSGLPKGDVYAVGGTLRLQAGVFNNKERTASFLWGDPDPDQNLPNTDLRLLTRRPCTADSDCAGSGAACASQCSPNTLTCAAPAEGSGCDSNNDGTVDAICCNGACGTTGGDVQTVQSQLVCTSTATNACP